MSILQEYEQIRKEMGEKKFDSIETYLKTTPNLLLSDILYKPENYIEFDKWYNWKILNRTVKVISIYETDYDDVRCDAILCIKLPKISERSKLLQSIYDDVCESDSSMCHISIDDWNEFYKDNYTQKDFDNLKNEVNELGLKDVITFDDCDYKIVGWSDFETRFNDDRFIQNKILGERGER